MLTPPFLSNELTAIILPLFSTHESKLKAHQFLDDFIFQIQNLPQLDAQRVVEKLKIVLPDHLQKLSQIEAPELIKVQFTGMLLNYFLGDRGLIDLDEVQQLELGDVVPYAKLTTEDFDAGETAISTVGFLKLNGGLGTTMGCTGPKSAIAVDGTRNFLDFIVDQIVALQTQYHCQIPLILLNSYHTEAATEDLMGNRLPFVSLKQHQVPRIDVRTGEPVQFKNDINAEWNPPGHGDLYAALISSGTLQSLIDQGIRYLFVSNSDNLGASIDLKILGYMIRNQLDFLMETTPKTPSDRKGGTLVRHHNRLFLLERAQVSADQNSEFENINRFQIFNTNNIWLDLTKINARLQKMDMDLPLIVNPKTVNGVRVDQLESAMGSAISLFDRSASVVVPRNRFMPVKSVADLMLLRSDVTEKLPSGEVRISRHRTRRGLPDIQLGTAYQSVSAFDQLVPHIPSLLRCRSLEVSGAVHFGPEVSISGEVWISTTHPEGLHLSHIALKDEELIHTLDGTLIRTPLTG